MKGPLLCFVFIVSTALLIAADNEPAQQKPPDTAEKKTANPNAGYSGGVRFLPNPTPQTGASGDVYGVAISPDGKRVANIGGTFVPAAGFVSSSQIVCFPVQSQASAGWVVELVWRR